MSDGTTLLVRLSEDGIRCIVTSFVPEAHVATKSLVVNCLSLSVRMMSGDPYGITQFPKITGAPLAAVIFATEIACVSFEKQSVITTINRLPSFIHISRPKISKVANFRDSDIKNRPDSC